MCLHHLDLRITTESRIAASLGEYSTKRQQALEEATAGKSNYDAGIEYLDRNYGSAFDGKASNDDSLKNISGIMGKTKCQLLQLNVGDNVLFVSKNTMAHHVASDKTMIFIYHVQLKPRNR